MTDWGNHMASSREYMEFIAEQLSLAGTITYRKMFGEYGVYCDGVFFGSVEDDQLYIKITEDGGAFLKDPVIASPHQGARYYLVEELDDRDFLGELVRRTCAQLPPPKAKKK